MCPSPVTNRGPAWWISWCQLPTVSESTPYNLSCGWALNLERVSSACVFLWAYVKCGSLAEWPLSPFQVRSPQSTLGVSWSFSRVFLWRHPLFVQLFLRVNVVILLLLFPLTLLFCLCKGFPTYILGLWSCTEFFLDSCPHCGSITQHLFDPSVGRKP